MIASGVPSRPHSAKVVDADHVFVAFLLCVVLVWLGGIFYAMRKGLNELITGLASIDQRLARLESLANARRDGPPASPPETSAT